MSQAHTILVVDDDPSGRDFLSYLLTAHGYSVLMAENGAQALQIAKIQPPDLIISDLLMPEVDGFELTRRLRLDPAFKELPVIFYSGSYSDADQKSLAAQAGVTSTVKKPAEVPVILKAIEAALQNKGPNVSFDPALYAEGHVRVLSEKLAEKVQELTQANAELQTARKALEIEIQERRQGEARYRMLFDYNPNPMWVFDLDTLMFLAVNEAAIRKYGYTRGEFLAMSIGKIRPRGDVPRLLNSVARVSAGPDESSGWRHLTKDGKVIEVEISAHTLKFETHHAQLVVVFDVTERNRAQSELRKSEARFSTAFHSSPLAMTVSTEVDGKYLDVNAAFCKMMGYERQEIIGRTAESLGFWDTLANRAAMIAELKKAGHLDKWRATYKPKSGESRVADVTAELVELEGQQCVLAISQDMTDSLVMENQLRQAQKMEAVGLLAGGVAHDFNNLLSVIVGNAELLGEKVKDEARLTKRVDEIKRAGQRAAGLTGQLLAFSRQQVLSPRPVAANDIVGETIKMLERIIGENIKIEVKLDPALWPIVADPGQLQQVIMNLCINARDAMPRGGILSIETANVELDETYARLHIPAKAGAFVVLSVADTGIGMDAETQRRIFEPFFTTKKAGHGTGLGLATTYGIVKQSQGFIWVYSEVEHGTTFKVYLPKSNVLGVPATANIEKAAPDLRGSELVLVTEDQDEYRELLVEVLEDLGYEVLSAPDGVAALAACENTSQPLELLITDVIMPEMSGPDLARKLREKFPQLQVIYMSGYTYDAINRMGGVEEGASFLQKPVGPKDLARKVREVLDAE
jgi:PAS domain S-box